MNRVRMQTGKILAEHYRLALGLDAESAYCDRKGSWYHVPKRFPAVFFDHYGCVVFFDRAEFDGCAHQMKFLKDGARGERTLEIPGKLSSLPKYQRLTPPPGTI